MKILMGVDDSKYSEDVTRTIVTQFRTEHTAVRVLHVLQPSAPAPPQMAPGYAPELDDQKKPALEIRRRINNREIAITAGIFDGQAQVSLGINRIIIAPVGDWGDGDAGAEAVRVRHGIERERAAPAPAPPT